MATNRSGPGALNLVKLCVGAESPADLKAWHAKRRAESGEGVRWRPRHTTRMTPKRGEELLKGGSLYWVFKGRILARQRLLALEPNEGADGIQRTDLVLEPKLILTRAQPRRPFQGWRYLTDAEAPADLTDQKSAPEEALPRELAEALETIGLR